MTKKSHWNYRVMREKIDGETYEFSLREVYYRGEEITGYTLDKIEPSAESAEELAAVMSMMVSALAKPVLDMETLEEIP